MFSVHSNCSTMDSRRCRNSPGRSERQVWKERRVSVCVWRRGRVSEWVPAQVTPDTWGVTSSSQTPPLVEEEAPLLNTYRTKIFRHKSRRDSKPRITVLARASCNLTDRPTGLHRAMYIWTHSIRSIKFYSNFPCVAYFTLTRFHKGLLRGSSSH
jgi:hypothetical protein